MVFQRGNIPHNKGKTKDSYEPLSRVSISKKGSLNPMFGKKAWNDHKGYEDFIGKKFTRLTVIEDIGVIARGHRNFRCLCECGKSVIVDATKLNNGHTRSCGCIRKGTFQLSHRKNYGEASMNSLILTYKSNARHRNYDFSLTKEECIILFKGNCFYCGCEPSSMTRGRGYNGEFFYNGIDRIDNNLGYILDNCVSCCKQCNFKKGSQNHTFFLQWIKRVYEHKFKEEKL